MSDEVGLSYHSSPRKRIVFGDFYFVKPVFRFG